MKVAAFFLKRPRFAAVLALAALLAGLLAAPRLRLALYPTLARPAISVSCVYPGANSVELMNTVAGPLEEKINGVEGMDRMTSTCYDSGAYSLTVSFAVGYDRDLALMKVQSRVQQALSLLPQEVKNIGVTVESGTTEELGILTVRSAGGKLTHDQVADYVFGVIDPAIRRVAGVDKTLVLDDKLSVRVWMNPERLAALGLNTEDVVRAIQSQNVQASLGTLGANPSGDGTARVVTLVSKGRLSTPEEFGEIIVATDARGGLVRLRDVATVDLGLQGYSYASYYEETPSVCSALFLLPGANPLEAMRDVKAELKRLEPFFPGDLAWDMTFDTTDFMYGTLKGFVRALVFGLLLAFAFCWAALRSWRAALAAVLSTLVPVSLTAVTLLVTGFQVTLPALYALLAALAFAIGAATWTLAGLRRGELPGGRVVAAGAALAGVALPLALIDGVQGVLFRQFSIVVAPMALASAFCAVLILPALSQRLFGSLTLARPDEAPAAPRAAGLLAHVRGVIAQWTSGRRLFVLGLAALVGLSARFVARDLPQEFVPDEDVGVMYVEFKAAEGTSLSSMDAIMKRVYREIRGIDGIAKCATLLGDSVSYGQGENLAKLVVVLKDWSERTADESSYAVSRRIQQVLDGIPEAECTVLRQPPVRGLGSQGGVCCLLQSVGDNEPLRFSRESLRMRREFQKSPLAETVTGGFYADTPHLRVTVDRAKCELMKVPMSSLYTVLQHNLGSVYVNDVNLGTQVNRVTVMSDWTGRARAGDIRRLYVRSQAGAMVPVDTLVSCQEENAPRACYRCNQYLYCTLQFIPKPGVSESEAIGEVRRICRERLSPGFINDWAGITYEALKSRGDEGWLVALSLLAVYLVLVAFKESLSEAFWLLLPSVSSVFGAVAALRLFGVSFSVYSGYVLLLLVALTASLSLLAESSSRGRRALAVLAALMALPAACTSGAGAAGNASFALSFLGGCLCYALFDIIRQGKPLGRETNG